MVTYIFSNLENLLYIIFYINSVTAHFVFLIKAHFVLYFVKLYDNWTPLIFSRSFHSTIAMI